MSNDSPSLNTRQTAAVTCQVMKDLMRNKEFSDLLENVVSNAIEKKLNEMLTRIQIVEGDVLDLQSNLEMKNKEIKRLEGKITNCDNVIEKLENAVNSMEQYSRRACIRIFGIDEASGENTDAIVSDVVTKQLGVPLDVERDIDRSHRVGKMKDVPSSSSTAQAQPSEMLPSESGEASTKHAKKPRPRSIIVKLTSYRKRKEILDNRKKLKNSGVSIVEDLTSRNQKLLAVTRGTKGVQAAWSSDGRIIALIPASGGKSVKKLISSESDLQHI